MRICGCGAGPREDGLTNLSTAVPAGTAATGAPDTLTLILTSLGDGKAEDVVTIDLRGRSSMADHMVIASGRSARQVTAIAEKLADRLKAAHGKRPRIEGRDTGDWVLIDAGDAIVHVFRPEVRAFYKLEEMWRETDGRPRRVSPGISIET